MLGGLLAFLSAALFGLNNAATRRGVLNGTSIQAMAITVPMGAALFFVACAVTGTLGSVAAFSMPAIVCFALAGFAHFVFGRYCNYRAIAAIGTNLASPIQQWELLVTLVLAIAFLGEKLTPAMVLAIGLLLLGPAIAARIESKPKAVENANPQQTSGFEPRYAEGYFYAFLSIFGYGASPIFVRAGLENAGLGASLGAGLVSYLAATIIVVVVVVALRQTDHVTSVQREPARWFAFAGGLVFLSQMFRYMALALAPASVVAPILRLQTLFRFYFSWMLTREHEVFDRHVILGTAISLAGALLLTLNVEAIASALALPDILVALLRWRWP